MWKGLVLHTATGTHHTFTQYYTVFYTVSITVLQCRTDTYYKVLVSRLPATSATMHMHHVCLYRELLHLCKTPRILGTVKLRTEAPPTVTPSSHQYWQKLCSSYLQMFLKMSIFRKKKYLFTSMRRSLAPLPSVVEEACARDKVNICWELQRRGQHSEENVGLVSIVSPIPYDICVGSPISHLLNARSA